MQRPKSLIGDNGEVREIWTEDLKRFVPSAEVSVHGVLLRRICARNAARPRALSALSTYGLSVNRLVPRARRRRGASSSAARCW